MIDTTPTKHPAPLAYPIPDAARALGIGKSTVYAEIAAGRLTAKKIGRRTVVLAEDLRAWLAGLPSFDAAA